MWLGDELFAFHPIIGRSLTPGLHTLTHQEWGGYTISVNSLGFRASNDFTPAKKPGISRILLFGDSNAFGDGVNYEISFAGVLEKLLSHVEIYNFALPGFALDQQYLCYKAIASQYEHDLVLIVPTIETIRKLTARFILVQDQQKLQRCLEKPFFDVQQGQLVQGHVPTSESFIDIEKLSEEDKARIYRATPFADVRRLLDNTRPVKQRKKRFHFIDRLIFLLKKMGVRDTITKVRPYPEYDTPNTPAWVIMRSIFLEWAANTSEPIMVTPLPSYIYVKERADAKNYQMRFHELEKSTACTLYDPLPDLLKLSMEERRELYYLEGHLTPQGHTWLAKRTVPHIKHILKQK